MWNKIKEQIQGDLGDEGCLRGRVSIRVSRLGLTRAYVNVCPSAHTVLRSSGYFAPSDPSFRSDDRRSTATFPPFLFRLTGVREMGYREQRFTYHFKFNWKLDDHTVTRISMMNF